MVNSTNYNIAITPGMQSQVNAAKSLRFGEQKAQTENIADVKDAKIKYHKIKESDKYLVHGNWSEDYAITVEVDNSSHKVEEDMTKLMSRYKLITFVKPASKIQKTYLKSCYKIDLIESPQRYRGAGTKAVLALLEKSLADKETEGRIVVNAEITDGQTSPAGFFYKLGFRFVDKSMNEIMGKWLEKKIEIEAPKLTGMMYLPKQSINKLLMTSMKY